jgi:hypothetical protein
VAGSTLFSTSTSEIAKPGLVDGLAIGLEATGKTIPSAEATHSAGGSTETSDAHEASGEAKGDPAGDGEARGEPSEEGVAAGEPDGEGQTSGVDAVVCIENDTAVPPLRDTASMLAVSSVTTAPMVRVRSITRLLLWGGPSSDSLPNAGRRATRRHRRPSRKYLSSSPG